MMASSNPAEKPLVEPGAKRRFRFGLRGLFALSVAAGLLIGIPIWLDVPVVVAGFAAVWTILSLLGTVGIYSLVFRRRITRCEMLVSGGIVWFLVCCIASTFHGTGPVRRSVCNNNLKQIGVALDRYHDAYGCLPPPYIADESGRPMHSWRVLILPFLEQKDLYDQYDFDQPWNSPHNRRVTGIHVSAFHCPEDGPWESQDTSYLAVVGPETIWRRGKLVRLSDVADGTSSTLAVVEVRDTGIHWAEPRDLDAAQLALGVNSETGPGVSSFHVNRNWFARPWGAIVLIADGSTRFLVNDTRPAVLQAMATASGGETIEPDDFRR